MTDELLCREIVRILSDAFSYEAVPKSMVHEIVFQAGIDVSPGRVSLCVHALLAGGVLVPVESTPTVDTRVHVQPWWWVNNYGIVHTTSSVKYDYERVRQYLRRHSSE